MNTIDIEEENTHLQVIGAVAATIFILLKGKKLCDCIHITSISCYCSNPILWWSAYSKPFKRSYITRTTCQLSFVLTIPGRSLHKYWLNICIFDASCRSFCQSIWVDASKTSNYTSIASYMNLIAPPGHVEKLVGPSGGGKSSIISLIQHLYEPSSQYK